MSKSNAFHEYLMSDVFAEFSGITAKRMFGGYGYYKDGIIFAILGDEDKVYFKVGEGNKKDYEDAGSKPFTFPMQNGKMVTMSYWELPVDVLENRDELEKWIEKSVSQSLKSKIRKS